MAKAINLGASSGIGAANVLNSFQQGLGIQQQREADARKARADEQAIRRAGILNEQAEQELQFNQETQPLRRQALSLENVGKTLDNQGKVIDQNRDAIALGEEQTVATRNQENKAALDEAERARIKAATAKNNSEAIVARLEASRTAVEQALADEDEENLPAQVQRKQLQNIISTVFDLGELSKVNPESALNQARNSPLLREFADRLGEVRYEDGTISFLDTNGQVLIDDDGLQDDGEAEPLTFSVDEVPDDLLKSIRPAEYQARVKQRDGEIKRDFETFKASLQNTNRTDMTDYQRFRATNSLNNYIGREVEDMLVTVYGATVFTDGTNSLAPAQKKEALLIAQRVAKRATQPGAPSALEIMQEEMFHPKLTKQATELTGLNDEQLERYIDEVLALQRSADGDTDITRLSILEGVIKSAKKQ